MDRSGNILVYALWNPHFGDSPSGKAADFDSAIRGFESLIPNHLKLNRIDFSEKPI